VDQTPGKENLRARTTWSKKLSGIIHFNE
jgi:hypothetical protein